MPAPPNSTPIETTCQHVKARLDAGDDFVLLDCRETDEHQLVHIAAAKLLPMSELMVRVAELEEHRDRNVIVHCHHGGRSARVTTWLRQQGFASVQNMTGGIDAWSQKIDSAVPRYK